MFMRQKGMDINMKKTIIIGLTGQTGSGKTTVSNYLKENGYAIIDADKVAREIILPDSDCILKVEKAFGNEVINSDGSLNRKKLGGIVFKNSEKLELLSSIVNPYIIEKIKEKINILKPVSSIIFIDAPTLFESGAYKLCDKTISIIADEKIRLERIMNRDDLTLIQAKNRINSQNNDEYYISKSDYTVYNNGDITYINKHINDILNAIFKSEDMW